MYLRVLSFILPVSLVLLSACGGNPGVTPPAHVDSKGFGGGNQVKSLANQAKEEAERILRALYRGAESFAIGDKRYCNTPFVCATLEQGAPNLKVVRDYVGDRAKLARLLEAFEDSTLEFTDDPAVTRGNQAYTEGSLITFLIKRVAGLTLADFIALMLHEHLHAIHSQQGVGGLDIETFADLFGTSLVAWRNWESGMQPAGARPGTASAPTPTPTPTVTATPTPPPPPPPPAPIRETVYRTSVHVSWAYGPLNFLHNPGMPILPAFQGLSCAQAGVDAVYWYRMPGTNIFFYHHAYLVMPGWEYMALAFCVSKTFQAGMQPLYRYQNELHGTILVVGGGAPSGDGYTWTRETLIGWVYPLP